VKTDIIIRLKDSLESIRRVDVDTDVEFWCARDLMKELGYRSWRNFKSVIGKAKKACDNAGHGLRDHFADIIKKARIGTGAERPIEDIALTRYACYLIAQNGDPSKPGIAMYIARFITSQR
jgi:DNA-damage-inducible protein D